MDYLKQYNITIKQFCNLLAFNILISSDHDLVSPDYILEKYSRYIGDPSLIKNDDSSDWGLHPNTKRNVFEPYMIKWFGQNWERINKIADIK